MKLVFKIIIFVFLIFLGCYPVNESSVEYRFRIVESSKKYIGNVKINYGSKVYDFDCSGFVKFVFLDALGVDIDKKIPFFTTSKSLDYYNFLRMRGFVSFNNFSSGDLIFFNNTYDRNMNGKLDDPITHIGIVIGVDEITGSIVFVDKSKGKNVSIKFMNLNRKRERMVFVNGKMYEVNSYIRDDGKYKFLASEVFAGFGDIRGFLVDR